MSRRRPTGCPSRSSARAAARSGPPSPPTGTAPRSPTPASRTTCTWATGCGHTGRVLPTLGSREAALQRRLGRQVEPVRHHGRGLRQGPRHGRWVARPERCRRARGVPARAAAERALRVPEHRRPEDEHLQGHRRDRPCHRGAAAAGAAALPVPAPQAAQGHRVRPRGRHHPGPVRRVRPDRGGRGGQARTRASCRRTRRRSCARA